MQLAATLLIVVFAAAIVLRKAWQLFHSGGKTGCGTGCGSCPASVADTQAKQPIISLDLAPPRHA